MKVVFATAEVSPIAKTGGLGDVCGSLPKALAALGHDIVVFMPYYRQARHWFDHHDEPVHQALPTTTITWGNWSAEATFLRSRLPGTDIPLILVANEFFFERDQIYARAADGIDDFLLRYVFFSRAVIRGCELLGIAPDILHCHDWHTAMLPVYLEAGLRSRPQFRTTRSVYTIHNLNYQGVAAATAYPILGLHERYWTPEAVEHFREINPMKAGIQLADQVTTVSPNYAREIQTPPLGAGLDGLLRHFAPKLTGILNGIDVEEWDPQTDRFTGSPFSVDDLRGKAIAKRKLLKEAGLPYRARTPLLSVVSRLVGQKGFQLLTPILGRLLEAGAQAVILGSGEPDQERDFTEIAERYPDRCRVWLGFDNALAHRIYAGSDIMLMPSMYEPCGLNQMYALRYGTIPVVRLTGGLADTVLPFDGTNLTVATGFGFSSLEPADLHTTTWLAMLNFADGTVWKALQTNGMQTDFSWDLSALRYDEIYRRAAAAV